jgi:hypothetical protein
MEFGLFTDEIFDTCKYELRDVLSIPYHDLLDIFGSTQRDVGDWTRGPGHSLRNNVLILATYSFYLTTANHSCVEVDVKVSTSLCVYNTRKNQRKASN